MKTNPKSKGTWIHRFAIRLFTGVLAILIFWVLGFLVDDIRSVRGPDYQSIEAKYLDKGLQTKQAALQKQIDELTSQISNQTEKQKLLGDSSRNLQQTINQLVELQRVGMEKNVTFSATEKDSFASSLNLFLDNQKRYQELSQTISGMVGQKQDLARQKVQIERQIEEQRRPAMQEYDQIQRRHRLKLAALQLAILLPILLVAAGIIVKKHDSIYFPIFLAFGGATLLKVALVVHEYFPSRLFKYILIGVLLVVVTRMLVHFIRTIAFPKTQWLVKQYREAYERFLCPVCEYPIRTGPRRYLFWTRRTVNKNVVPGEKGEQEETYTCPSCGTGLFEECPSCHKVRHAMLPNCSHCGAEKEIGGDSEASATD
jgi:predicted RNA-binding Zn-ribbon protein involved in translation (DUF1610 family)